MLKSAAVLWCLTLASAYLTSEQEKCPELEADWTEKIDKMLSCLPESYTTVSSALMPLGDVILGNVSIRNLRRSLEVNQPYRTFCNEIGRIIVISMQCRDGCLRAIIPSNFTNVEYSGKIVFLLRKLQLDVHILVTGTKVHTVFNIQTVVPGQVEVGGVQMEGVASWVYVVTEKLEPLFRDVLEPAWRNFVFLHLPGVFRHAAQQCAL